MKPYIELFGRTYPSYGTFMAIGAIFALFLGMFVTRRKYKLEYFDYGLNIVWTFVASIIGAKLLYLIVELRSFIENPKLFIAFIGGGGVFYGGLIGALVGCFISCRIRKWNYIEVIDTLTPCVVFAHSSGRVGCFMAGCCYGMETDSPLGVYFPEGSNAPTGVKLLPTQLFEAIFLFLLGLTLLLILWKCKKSGVVVSVYLLSYAVWRFVIEFFRSDRRGDVGVLTTSQFISIFILLAGLLILIFRKHLVTLCDKIKNLPTLKERRQAKKSADK